MIHPQYCYRKLGESVFIQDYFDNLNANELEFEDYFGLLVHRLDSEIYLKEPLLAEVNKTHKISQAGFIKTEPWRNYAWHQDAIRGVGINLLLTPRVNSMVMFGEGLNNDTVEFSIMPFQYEPRQFYLFNTQIMHTIINFDQPRYLFTVDFEEDKESLTYERIQL